MPVDRQLDFKMHALDVLHSFWVPEWRIKRDNVPRHRRRHAIVTPDQVGHLPADLHRALRLRPRDDASARSWSRGQDDFDAVGRRAAAGNGPAGLAASRSRQDTETQPGARRRRRGMMEGLDGGCDQATGLDRGRARSAASAPPSASASSSPCARSPGLPTFQTEQTGYPHVDRARDHRAARLPGRLRLLRLLVPLGGGRCRRSPRTTPSTAPRAGRTTSTSTPITR